MFDIFMQSFTFVSSYKLHGRLGDQYQVTLCIISYVWRACLFPCYPTSAPILIISKSHRMGFLQFSIVVLCFVTLSRVMIGCVKMELTRVMMSCVKLSSDDWLCENGVNKSDDELCEIVK